MAGVTASNGSIGVALAGGGHRASAWALGSLLALVDSGAARRVASIASVSGGSITNGYVAAQCEYREQGADFEGQVVRPLAMALAGSGTVFAHGEAGMVKVALFDFAKFSVAVLILLGATLGVLVPACILGWAWRGYIVQALVFEVVAAGLGIAGLATAIFRRGAAARKGYDVFYSRKLLAALDRSTEHVFCATDLQCAEHVYFSQRFVYAYRFGVGRPGRLPLGDAVAASAAFPGAFPPLSLSTSCFALEHGADRPRERLVLQDGGVYDNMGDQWFSGLAKRLSGKDADSNSPARSAALRAACALKTNPEELIVCNGSPSFPVSAFQHGKGLAWELEALYRVGLALYDQTTAGRRSTIIANLRLSRQRVAIVQVETSVARALSSAPVAAEDPS